MKVADGFFEKTGERLTKTQVKDKWRNLQKKAEKAQSEHKKAKKVTGGGPNPTKAPTDSQNLVLDASGSIDVNFSRSYDQESAALKERFEKTAHQNQLEFE